MSAPHLLLLVVDVVQRVERAVQRQVAGLPRSLGQAREHLRLQELPHAAGQQARARGGRGGGGGQLQQQDEEEEERRHHVY